MNIRRSAWHFRVYLLLVSMWTEGPDVFNGRRSTHVPRDLCHYFWTLTLLAILSPLWATLALIVTIAWLLLVIGLIVVDYVLSPPLRKLSREIERLEESHPPKSKQPGLVRTYVKARKQKICPIITIVDE